MSRINRPWSVVAFSGSTLRRFADLEAALAFLAEVGPTARITQTAWIRGCAVPRTFDLRTPMPLAWLDESAHV